MGLNNDIGGPAWKYEHTHGDVRKRDLSYGKCYVKYLMTDHHGESFSAQLQGRLFCTAIFLIARLNCISIIAVARDFAAIALVSFGVSYV
jgi:hypothetical protein